MRWWGFASVLATLLACGDGTSISIPRCEPIEGTTGADKLRFDPCPVCATDDHCPEGEVCDARGYCGRPFETGTGGSGGLGGAGGEGGMGGTPPAVRCETDDDCDGLPCLAATEEEDTRCARLITSVIATPAIDPYLQSGSCNEDCGPGEVAVGLGGSDEIAYWRVALSDTLSDPSIGAPDRIEMCVAMIVEDRLVVGVFGQCQEAEVLFSEEDGTITVPITSAELLVAPPPAPEHALWYQEARLHWYE